MGARIHPSAVIAEDVRIASGVEIGPFCYIGPRTVLETGVVLHSHVVVSGHTTIGEDAVVFPHTCLGGEPQDMKFDGEESFLEIGARSVIRENVNISRGTQGGGLYTRIGKDCLFQCNSHIGHDCIIGNHVIFSGHAVVAGHCRVDDFAILGGNCAIHQFVRIGTHSIVGGMTGIRHNVPPYVLVSGIPGTLKGLNLIGLRRHGFSSGDIRTLNEAYRLLFHGDRPLRERASALKEAFPDNTHVALLRDFALDAGKSALCMPESRTWEGGTAEE